MKIFITGSTGFIGKNLVKKLSNHDISCLVRTSSSKSDIKFLKDCNACLVYGDITKKETYRQAIKDADVIIHLAGILGQFNINNKKYHLVNVLGTKQLVALCKKQKIIYCSSAGVLGPIVNGKETDKPKPTNQYEKSKLDAERIVETYTNSIILRPGFVYGEYDNQTIKLLKAIENHRFFLLGRHDSKIQPTYIDDLIFCILKCLRDKTGKKYIIAGERPVTIREFYNLVAYYVCVRTNNFYIPITIAKLYVSFVEPICKTLKINPILTKTRLEFFTRTRTYDTSKIKKDLDYQPIKLEIGLKRTIDWYKQYHP